MKLLHYSLKQERPGYGIEEYIVLVDDDRCTKELQESFRRDAYDLQGVHDVETSNDHLPTERELEAQ